MQTPVTNIQGKWKHAFSCRGDAATLLDLGQDTVQTPVTNIQGKWKHAFSCRGDAATLLDQGQDTVKTPREVR